MKKIICLAVGLLALNLAPVFGQQPPQTFAQRQAAIEAADKANNEAPPLTKFDLDFPGGTAKELVAAIEKSMGKPLNVIIPDDATNNLPSIKLHDITFQQLSDTLRNGSFKPITLRAQNGTYFTVDVGYYFVTADNQPTDNSVWYFRIQNVPPPPSIEKVVKFYPLAPYLNSGLTVDDITTAIQTGWKMSGDNSPPELNYHKETKLLMAYGEPDKLQVIDDVLKALEHTDYSVSIDPATGLPLSKEQAPAEKTGAIDPTTGGPILKEYFSHRKNIVSTNSPAEKTGK